MQPTQAPGWSRFVLVLGGIASLVFGVLLALNPVGWLARVGVTIGADAISRIEVGAFYGGIEIGLGLLLIAASTHRHTVRVGLWLLFASQAGIGLTRLLLMLASDTWPPMFLGFLVYELGFAALALGGLLARPRLRHRL